MAFSLRQLRYFVATAELGQISQAAVELSISQSAVTTAIKELEQILGVGLFLRTPHGMNLTEAGRQFLSHAYDILNKVDEALRLDFVSSDIEGVLTVAATYTVIGYFLPVHIERLRRLFPKLEIQLFEQNRESIEEGLLTNRYDLSVLLTSNILDPQLATETLMSSTRRLWVPAQHPLLQREDVGLREIAQEPYIMLTVDEAAHSTLKYWSQSPYQPRVMLRTSSIEAVRSMVANGLGVAILSDMVHRPGRWKDAGSRPSMCAIPCRPWISASPGGGAANSAPPPRRCACISAISAISTAQIWRGREGPGPSRFALESVGEDAADPGLVERDRVATGAGVLQAHAHHGVDVDIRQPHAGELIRDPQILAQRDNPVSTPSASLRGRSSTRASKASLPAMAGVLKVMT